MEIQYFPPQRHALLTSFGIFVVTYRVTNALPKLVDILLFFMKKLNFHFLKSLFSTISGSLVPCFLQTYMKTCNWVGGGENLTLRPLGSQQVSGVKL